MFPKLSSVWLFAFVKAGRHGLWKTGGWPYVSGPEHPAGHGALGRVSVHRVQRPPERLSVSQAASPQNLASLRLGKSEPSTSGTSKTE